MNADLIRRWNDRVQPGDTVYHLGDFAMGPRDNIGDYRRRLQGRIVLVRGNHDRSVSAMLAAGFDEVHNSLTIDCHGHRVFMRHIPPVDDAHPGKKYREHFLQPPPDNYDYWLCGHVHQRWVARGPYVINVGVDVWDYTPRTLDELVRYQL